MGSRMATNLQKKGYELVAHHRIKSKTDGLVKNGARWVASCGEVAKTTDVFFPMLPYPQDIGKAEKVRTVSWSISTLAHCG
jgi:3-hydroxyisobutyrate dehydrogenase-like beta-hydroxyacid dehydrogenase